MKIPLFCLAAVACIGLSAALSIGTSADELKELKTLLENYKRSALGNQEEGKEVKSTKLEEEEGTEQEFRIDPAKRGFYNFKSTGFPTGYTEYCSSQSFKANVGGYTTYSLKVAFNDFDLEPANPDGSCNDKVTMYDGYDNTDPVLGEFCGSRSPFSVYTSGQYIRVEFTKVRNNVMGRGFSAEFDYLPISSIPSDANQFGSIAPVPAPAPSTPAPSSGGSSGGSSGSAGSDVGPDADGVTIVNQGVRDNCLDSHNYVRALHQNTPAMTYDVSLEASAQEWARHLAANDLFEHASDRNGAGENLYKRWVGGNTDAATCARATYSWWEERHDYNFANGQSTGGVIGHFTQVVWTTSIRVACGVAKIFRNGFTETLIVARYSPPGNYYGQNTAKVMNYANGATMPTSYTDLE